MQQVMLHIIEMFQCSDRGESLKLCRQVGKNVNKQIITSCDFHRHAEHTRRNV